MISYTSRGERGAILGDQSLYWTIIRDPSFLSPLDHAIQSNDIFRLLRTQSFLQALETEQDSVLTFLTMERNIRLILNTMLQDLPKLRTTQPAKTSYNFDYTDNDICAIDNLLQTARFGTKFYGAILSSKELPRFLTRWVESEVYLVVHQAERFASFIKHIVWHESRRMQFIRVLSSTLSELHCDKLLMRTCNHHIADALTAIFQTCMPLVDSDNGKTPAAHIRTSIVQRFQLNKVLARELSRCIEQDNISYVESIRFENLCAFVSEMIRYNHPLLQPNFYSCVCTLAQFLFQDSLVLTRTGEHIHATLDVIGETVVSAMSFLMRSTHSYLRKPEVIAEVQALLEKCTNAQVLYTSKTTNKHLQSSGKRHRAVGVQAASNSFSVNSAIMDDSDLERHLRSSVESSKKPSRLASPFIRRSRNKVYDTVGSRESSTSQCFIKLQPAVMDQLYSTMPHASTLSFLWQLFSDKNEQLVRYCYINYVKYVLHFYEEDEGRIRQIHHVFESASSATGFSSSEKSMSDHELNLGPFSTLYACENNESPTPATALHPDRGRYSIGTSMTSSIVSEASHNFTPAFTATDTMAAHTIEPIIGHRDQLDFSSDSKISHSRSLSYAGKGESNRHQPDIDGASLSNNSFTNIYRVSNRYDSSSLDQVFASDEDLTRRRRSATRTKPVKPKKLLSRYNPFIKARTTDYLHGLQNELNQTCQLFLNKIPEPLPLPLTIRLYYLARILSTVSDVRCLEYSNVSDKEPVSAFNNSIRQPDESMGYITSYSAELPPTADCGCGGPSEVSLKDLFIFCEQYQMPYSPLELSAQILKLKHLFSLVDCLGPIYRHSHTLNLLGNRFRQCSLDLSTLYPELLGILFPVTAERYDSFTAAIAMSSSPELKRSTFCVHLLSGVRAMLRKAVGITDEDLYKSRFIQLQTFASTLNIAPEPPTSFPITPVVSTKHLRGFTDSQVSKGASRTSGDIHAMVTPPLQIDRKPSRSILSMCGRSDRYQNSCIDFTQSELISINSPTQKHQLGKQEMCLPSNNVEDSASSFAVSSVADWEGAVSPGASSSRKKKSIKLGLALDIPSDPSPPREVVIPWTIKELLDIIRSSKISIDSVNHRYLDVCIKRKDVQLLNKLYLEAACRQRNFVDDHNNFMSAMRSYNHTDSIDGDQQNIFTESFILGIREKRQKNRTLRIQPSAATQRTRGQKEANFNSPLSDSVIRIENDLADQPRKLSVTGSTIRLPAQEQGSGEPKACAQHTTFDDNSDGSDIFKDLCDEKA